MPCWCWIGSVPVIQVLLDCRALSISTTASCANSCHKRRQERSASDEHLRVSSRALIHPKVIASLTLLLLHYPHATMDSANPDCNKHADKLSVQGHQHLQCLWNVWSSPQMIDCHDAATRIHPLDHITLGSCAVNKLPTTSPDVTMICRNKCCPLCTFSQDRALYSHRFPSVYGRMPLASLLRPKILYRWCLFSIFGRWPDLHRFVIAGTSAR